MKSGYNYKLVKKTKTAMSRLRYETSILGEDEIKYYRKLIIEQSSVKELIKMFNTSYYKDVLNDLPKEDIVIIKNRFLEKMKNELPDIDEKYFLVFLYICNEKLIDDEEIKIVKDFTYNREDLISYFIFNNYSNNYLSKINSKISINLYKNNKFIDKDEKYKLYIKYFEISENGHIFNLTSSDDLNNQLGCILYLLKNDKNKLFEIIKNALYNNKFNIYAMDNLLKILDSDDTIKLINLFINYERYNLIYHIDKDIKGSIFSWYDLKLNDHCKQIIDSIMMFKKISS